MHSITEMEDSRSPMPVQEKVIPVLLGDEVRDVVVLFPQFHFYIYTPKDLFEIEKIIKIQVPTPNIMKKQLYNLPPHY